MAGCGIRENKGKKLNTNIKSSIVINISNAVKIPGSIVSVPRAYSYDLGALHTIKLRR